MTRVLLIGFGPFPGAPHNPSAALAKALARRRRPALADAGRTAHVLATVYAAADRELSKLFAAKPDVVLMFGLAARRRHLSIETRARNAVSVLFPDAGGHRPRHGVIVPGGPPSRRGKAPFARLLGAARVSGLPVRLSSDAGRYVCNYTYWRALERSAGDGPLVQFVHIPAVLHSPQQRRSRRHSPSLARLVEAAEALLIGLIAASR